MKKALLRRLMCALLVLMLMPVSPGIVREAAADETDFPARCFALADDMLDMGDLEGAVRRYQVLAGVGMEGAEALYRYTQGRRAEAAEDWETALSLYQGLDVRDAQERAEQLAALHAQSAEANARQAQAESAAELQPHYACVSGNGVNVRPQAKKSGSLGQVSKGDTVLLLDTVTGADGEAWAHVRLEDGTEGYVPAKFAKQMTAEEEAAYLAASAPAQPETGTETVPAAAEQTAYPLPEADYMPIEKPQSDGETYALALALLSDGRAAAVAQAAQWLQALAEQGWRSSAAYDALAQVYLLTVENKFPCAYQKLEEFAREGYFAAWTEPEPGVPIPDAGTLNDYIFARELEYDGSARSAVGMYEGIACLNAPERMLHLYEQIDAMTPAEAAAGKTLADGVAVRVRRPDRLTYTIEEVVGDVLNRAGAEDLCADEYRKFEEDFGLRPVEAVLILDTSGSMASYNAANGKSVLSYAQDAAVAFQETLQAINPLSRVGVVGFSDSAVRVMEMKSKGDAAQLQRAIRAMEAYGQTNTGGGFAMARQMFEESPAEKPLRIAIMLSDGIANAGPDVLTEGTRLAALADVYTVGLVGALDEDYREYARSVLNAGYEKQYYEVEFGSVGDISLYLAEAFVKIAMQSISGEGGECYLLRADGALEVCVHNGSNQILCSETDLLFTESSFGALHLLGDEMDEKIIVLKPGDYDVMLRGRGVGMGTYTLQRFGGYTGEMILREEMIVTHPEETTILRLRGGSVTADTVRCNPADPMGRDPFSLRPSTGLRESAQGYLIKESRLYAAPESGAWEIGRAEANTPVAVYAQEPASGWYMIGLLDENDMWIRCYVPASAVEVLEYVPMLHVLDDPYALRAGKTAYLSPGRRGRSVGMIAQGPCRAIHAERDAEGYEWVLIETFVEGRKAWVYVTGRSLVGWQTITADNFRLEGKRPEIVWQRVFGENGYSEFMWAAPMQTGSGVIVSGRTSSSKGYITAPLGNRDAWLMQLTPAGEVAAAMTTGGSLVDSFHCVLPTEQGYYVSGITRSNDKAFSEIWNTGYYNGRSSSRLDRSNALVGFYDRNLAPVWLQSFGVGSASYGFDMVIELSNGDLAAVGWSTEGRGSVLNDHGRLDFFVVKMQKNGNVLGMNCFGGGLNDVPDSAAATPDGGLLMIGSTGTRSESENHTGYVVKLDSALNMEYQFTYGGSGDNVFDNVRLLDDGTFIITGFTDSPTGTGAGTSRGGYDFWALRIDAMGRPVWTKRYGGPGDEEVMGTTVLENGNIVILGSTTSQTGDVRGYRRGSGTTDGWALCIDKDGRILWQLCLGGKGNDYFNAAAVDPEDGCLVLAGATQARSDKDAKAWAVKIRMPAPTQAICP